MPFFLHQRVKSENDLLHLVATNAREVQHREFKREFWTDNEAKGIKAGEEAAKDVAAFANAEGGEIIIGINDNNGAASGWHPNPSTRGSTGRLVDALKDYLYPAEVAGTIQINEYALDIDGQKQDAMVVSIPPWAASIVGVKTKRGQGHRENSYFFPFRVHDKTLNLTLDEAMQRNEATKRVTYLRLLALAERRQGQLINLSSPLIVTAQGQTFPYSSNFPTQGKLGDIKEDSFLIAMDQRNYLHSTIRVQLPEALVSIPYSLVNSIWQGHAVDNIINLVLDAALIWTGQRWSLDTSNAWSPQTQ